MGVLLGRMGGDIVTPPEGVEVGGVPIPPGSRVLSLACLDAGSRHLMDLGNLVSAGFLLKEGEAKAKIRAARENGPWKVIPVPGIARLEKVVPAPALPRREQTPK